MKPLAQCPTAHAVAFQTNLSRERGRDGFSSKIKNQIKPESQLITYSMSTDVIAITSPADFHVHLRQGKMSELVTPHVRKGGFDLAYVMV
jgi:hypothetical protein